MRHQNIKDCIIGGLKNKIKQRRQQLLQRKPNKHKSRPPSIPNNPQPVHSSFLVGTIDARIQSLFIVYFLVVWNQLLSPPPLPLLFVVLGVGCLFGFPCLRGDASHRSDDAALHLAPAHVGLWKLR